MNLETGASGTVSKVVRIASWTVSTWPSKTMSIWPLQVGDDVGELVGGGAQVDRAFQGLCRAGGFLPSRSRSPRRRAVVGGELDSGAGILDVGVIDQLGGGRVTEVCGDVGVTGIGGQGRVQGGVAGPLGRSGEPEG